MNDKETNKESLNSTQNIKYDENGEEIIWELKEDKSSFAYFISLILAVFWTCFCLGFLLFDIELIRWQLSDEENFSLLIFFALICAFLIFLYMLSIFMKFFNQKRAYATKEYFIHQKHIGKETKMLIGSFYITTQFATQATGAMGTASLNFHLFSNGNKIFSDAKLMLSYAKDNCMEFLEHPLLIQKTKGSLISLDEKNYKEFLETINFTLGRYFCPEIDLKEIEKLREERKENS